MISDTSSNFEQSVDSSAFSIEMNSSMFTMLTKNVYNNTILAPQREWSTNAIDACIEAGVEPHFDVHLPTTSDPIFSVRDYGTGLPVEDIEGLFSVLGASTKRGSNSYNGTFGIGRMSGLAYATSFTVESFHNNNHHSYLISIDNGIPSSVHLSTVPTEEPNGLKLSLVVAPRDISDFHSEAKKLYKFFDHKPNLNIDLDLSYKVSISGDNWFIIPNTYHNYLIMGNVTYSLQNHKFPNGTCIQAPIGSVSITPGRESLTYDDKTNAFLKKALDDMYSDLDSKFQFDLASAATPMEEMKVVSNYVSSFGSNMFTVPTKPYYSQRYGSVYFTPDHPDAKFCYFNSYAGTCKETISFGINDHTVLIQDVLKSFAAGIRAYQSQNTDTSIIVAKPMTNSLKSIEALKDNLPTYLDSLGLPYVYISDYMPEQTVSTATGITSEEFYPMQYSRYNNRGSKASLTNTADTSTNYLYLVNGISYEDTIKPCLYARELIPNCPPLVVIPKKVQKAIEANPAYTPALDYFNKHFETNRTYITQPTFDLIYRPSLPIPAEAPADLIDSYNKVEAFRALDTVSTDVRHVANTFPITVETFKHNPSTVISKYPLFRTLYRIGYEKELAHYLKLEKHYEDTKHQASGLNSTDT